MKTGFYAKWPDKDINNATIVSRKVYFHDLTLYENLYAALNNDLKALVKFFEEVAAQKGVDAEKAARERVGK
jgi:hypothetical protein